MTKTNKSEIHRPNWDHWSKRRKASLLQAVALSCNVCPDWLMNTLNQEPWNTAAKDANNSISPRLTISIDRIAEIDRWGALLPSRRDKANFEISLSAFGSWARTVWDDLPDEFPRQNDETNDANDEQAKATKTEPRETLKSSALVREFSGIWPSIERDLRDKTRHSNTLLDEANISHGHYDVQMALRWAKTEGKISKDKASAYAKNATNSVLSALIGQLYNLD